MRTKDARYVLRDNMLFEMKQKECEDRKVLEKRLQGRESKEGRREGRKDEEGKEEERVVISHKARAF